MRDDPGKNLKWLEQELLSAEGHPQAAPKPGEIIYENPDDLLQRVDALLAEEPEIPAFVGRGKKTRASRAAAARAVPKLDENAAVLVQTRKQRKAAKKKAGVNRNIRGLVFLAVLELLGILAIIGWWLQWLI